jgi:hypothetical protein
MWCFAVAGMVVVATSSGVGAPTRVLLDPMACQLGVMEVKQGLGFALGNRGKVPLVPCRAGLKHVWASTPSSVA